MATSLGQLKGSTRFISHTISPKLVNCIGTIMFHFAREANLSCSLIQRRSSKIAAVKTPRQIQTFHSTLCMCDLGRNEIDFCTWRSCGICAIIKSAFATYEFGIKSKSGRSVQSTSNLSMCTVLTLVRARFGPGVYSYLKPSLADRWAECTPSPPYKLMLACEVNLSPPQVKPLESSGILQSVSVYVHSILLRSLTDVANLQHEEGPLVFVSAAEAITPKYLIVYSNIDLPSLPFPPLQDIPYYLFYLCLYIFTFGCFRLLFLLLPKWVSS